MIIFQTITAWLKWKAPVSPERILFSFPQKQLRKGRSCDCEAISPQQLPVPAGSSHTQEGHAEGSPEVEPPLGGCRPQDDGCEGASCRFPVNNKRNPHLNCRK